MNNIDVDNLAQIIRQVDGNHYLGAGVLAEAILDQLPAPQVIRTVEELKALDPETVLGVWNPALDMGCIFLTAGELMREPADPRIRWAVIASAAQVRAARKALEEA